MCPEAGFSRDEFVALVVALRQQVAAVQAAHAAVQAEYAAVAAENVALREEVARLQAELDKKGGPPWWAKANTPERAGGPRKKRAHNAARRCVAEPDATVEHAVDVCPECGQRLHDGWEDSIREVLVFPTAPVRVVHHRQMARRCGVCGAVVVGRPDPMEHKLVGQHRVDARGMSLIAYLHIIGRLPLRLLQHFLQVQLAVHLSLGGLCYILQTIAELGAADYDRLRDEIRRSAAVHLDETGWRENGHNGYVWASVTDAVRYFERHGTRSGRVPKELLGDAFCGVVVCDGYAGYDGLDCQLQRCWTHLLRHGHEAKARAPDDAAVREWVDTLKTLYQAAKTLVATPGYAQWAEARRESARLAFQARLLAHVAPAKTAPLPEQAKLAKFLDKHVNELFVFVEYPEVRSENNPAERAVRPLVVTRKVCGGTRSTQGSDTKMVLMSLLYTAQARGMDPLAALEQMLLGTPMFPVAR